MTPGVRRLVHEGADDSAIREQACKDGMKPLRVSGAMKVAQGLTTAEQGLTTAEEVLKVAPLA
jgi:general secretion pathway protein E